MTPNNKQIQQILSEALARRAPLTTAKDLNIYRIIHAAADNVPGLYLDRYADVLIAQQLEGQFTWPESAAREFAQHAMEQTQTTAVYRKTYPLDRNRAAAKLDEQHKNPTPWIGTPAPPEITAIENGLKFLIHPYDGYAVGLFCEQRGNRRRIREEAEGKTVLNLFAYTCGFAVAAGVGGATQVVNIDVSPRYLDWGRQNVAANDLPADRFQFHARDALDYLKQLQRQKRNFDMIVLDPPTFGRDRKTKSTFKLPDDWPRLLAGTVACLNPGGKLLISTNHRATSRRNLEQLLTTAARNRRVTILARPKTPLDFPNDGDFTKSIFAQID